MSIRKWFFLFGYQDRNYVHIFQPFVSGGFQVCFGSKPSIKRSLEWISDDYSLYYATLVDEEKAIIIEEVVYSDDIVGEKLFAQKEPNLSLFNDTELKILATVKEYFPSWKAGKISEFSHKEKGYEETDTGQHISYDYADQLNW